MARKKTKTNRKADASTHVEPRNPPVQSERISLVPVAAIGASAGGLDPIEKFFDAMPTDSGCAFVIIQHLSPDFRSLMDELLARHSSMKIRKIEDGMDVVPNSIYLNTPRTVMTIEGNTLRVEKVNPDDSVYLPINKFFESLAISRGEKAWGLILSGTGTDGTSGSKQIRNAGGAVLVQDPNTTRFEGMPNSIIAEGLSTLTAAPAILAKCVERLLKNESLVGFDTSEREPMPDPLSDILSMLKHSHGTNFLQYKEATIHRRIERRATINGIDDLGKYRDFVAANPNELPDLYADLLIEVTEFFRDKNAFGALDDMVISKLIEAQNDGGSIRVWVPGCASGEEAYSIGILLQEYARKNGLSLHLKIMATDIHHRSMSQASSGIYDEAALRRVPKELIDRYFDCADGQAQIKPQLRNLVFFSTHDVTRDPPFTRIDLITCRNLLIYLKEDAQQKVMNLLHFSLRKDGYLFLGPSEHIGAISHEFEPISEKWRIYKKLRDVKLLTTESIFKSTNLTSSALRSNSAPKMAIPSAHAPASDSLPFKRAHKAALESIVSQYAPPGFLLSEDGEVVHIFGDAGKFIPMQAGSFSRRLVDMIMPELKVIVTTALDHGRHSAFDGFKRSAFVRKDQDSATQYEVSLEPVELTGEGMNFLLLTVQEILAENKHEPINVEVSQAELDAFDSSEILRQRIGSLEHSLQASEESLQSTIEELETSNEELQSTNEELMSTNEELQSTNEELHSVNEELYTVSAEHQRKNEDLTERDIDITVLLQQSKIGTIHLDEQLKLERYTNNSRSVFNILPQDVGRPFDHITVRAVGNDIQELVESANINHTTHDTRILVDGELFLVRIMPYQHKSGDPSNVLITVIDITDFENVRTQLADMNIQYKDIVESTDTFIVRWEAQSGKIIECNQLYAQRWGKSPDELKGVNIIDIHPAAEQQKFQESLLNFQPDEVRTSTVQFADYKDRTCWANIYTRAISRDGVVVSEFQINGQDSTEEYRHRMALEKLFSALSDDILEYDERIEHLLDVGLKYFKLDTATLSMIVGQGYEVKVQKSRVNTPYRDGEKLSVIDSRISALVQSNVSVAVDNIIESDLDGFPSESETNIESIVGATVHTSHGPYGTVSFTAKNARGRSYSTRDESFALLIGSWIGFLIGNKEQNEFAEKQTEHYKNVFRNVPVMMFLCDKDGLILSASDRLCVKLGMDPDNLPGMNCVDLFSREDVPAIRHALAERDASRGAFTMTGSSGSPVHVELNSTTKTSGTLQGIRMIVLIDVTDRNRVLKDSEEQNRRLEVANESLNQFAFIASHDLQEPLRKIQQFSSFLEEDFGAKITEDGRFHLNTIVDASARMSTLIHDLLRYSGASQEEPKNELVSLNELMAEVSEELAMSLTEAKADLTISSLPDVEGDKGLIRQLFTNLVSNSIKYRDADRSLEITVKRYSAGSESGVMIVDNGIGFDMKFAKKVFEPFNRLHGPSEYKGNGIGLAICSTVCDKHNWRIYVDSQIGKGSAFSIDFQENIFE